MAKNKTLYQCTSCGMEQAKWLGRCPGCGEWNTFEEVRQAPQSVQGGDGSRKVRRAETLSLDTIRVEHDSRITTGIREFDRILGGGLVRGSSVLLGGEPGIGKSTLLLQLAGSLSGSETVLYISGEESPEQIKRRADRIGVSGDKIILAHETDMDRAAPLFDSVNPTVIFIDSIQTMMSTEAGVVPGTVNQIKYCSLETISWIKEHNAAVIFVAHVTKEGTIAGPKVIEHMVDTVMYFDYGNGELRILRATKNRFGSIDEIGLFAMGSAGIKEIEDPSQLLLSSRTGLAPPGIAVGAVFEGSRVLLVEIQALIVPGQGNISRVFSEGMDRNKISRIAAVCEKNLHLRFSDQDIYIHVAGGLKIGEIGIDLPLAMALYSARTDMAIPSHSVISGEISLAGEIRPTPHTVRRIRAAADAGFTLFISPPDEADKEGKDSRLPSGIDVRRVTSLGKAVEALFGNAKQG